MSTYRPSARVRLQLRTDELADTAALRRSLEKKPRAVHGMPSRQPQATAIDTQRELANLEQTRRGLVQMRSELPPTDYEAFIADLDRQRDELQGRLEQQGTKQNRPDALEGTPPDDRVIMANITPKTVTIERNGLKEADTCKIVLDYADAPIDPRVVRAAFVEVQLGAVGATEYEAGMRGARRADGSLRSIVGEGEGAGTFNVATRFLGWVDDWEVNTDGDDGDTITLDCRDMTALLHDQQLPAGIGLDMSLPIEQAVQSLLDSFPMTRGTRCFYGRPGQPSTVSGPASAGAVPKARKARRGKVARRARAGDQRMTLWDHIHETCTAVGVTPLFYGFDLHLINPRTFFAGTDAPRRMVYGINLRNLRFSRKLGGAAKVPTIEIRAYDPQLGRTRWARFPVPKGAPPSGVVGVTPAPAPGRANRTGVSGSSPEDKIHVMTLTGINDPDALARVAQSIYHEMGRQEIEGSFETSDITSYDASAAGDLLNMVAGDAVEILVRTQGQKLVEGETKTTLQELQSMSRARRAEYLVSLGFSRTIAERLSALQEAAGFSTVFRVRDVSLEWSHDDGLSIQCDFVNFIAVREDQLAERTSRETGEASPEVEAAIGGRKSQSAEQLRAVSAERRALTEKREAGTIDDEEYNRETNRLVELEKQRRRDVEAA